MEANLVHLISVYGALWGYRANEAPELQMDAQIGDTVIIFGIRMVLVLPGSMKRNFETPSLALHGQHVILGLMFVIWI